MTEVASDICELIESCLKEKLDNFDLIVHDGNSKGEGFLGELMFISLSHKKTDKQHHLVVKKILNVNEMVTQQFLSSCFSNEICFYTKVLTSFRNIQTLFPDAAKTDLSPKCYGTSIERLKEKLVLENLKFENFSVSPKSAPITKDMYENIFELYGQFHALSFAFKHYQSTEFDKLSTILCNTWLQLSKTDAFRMAVKNSFESVENFLKSAGDDHIIKKMEPYFNNAGEIFSKYLVYNGPHGVISHGDCWSNNMMFQFNKSKEVQKIKLIDFQMSHVTSPVFDLTYSFYSGASEENLTNLENFLKIYHSSLEKTLKAYDLDVRSIYPYDELKREWKSNCQFGFIMGTCIWGVRYVDEKDVKALDSPEGDESFFNADSKKGYKEALLSLVRHFYENDFLFSE